MWLWKNCAIVIPAYPCDVLFLRAFFAITFPSVHNRHVWHAFGLDLLDKAVVQHGEAFPAHSGQPEPAFVVSNNHVLIHPQRQLLANIRPVFLNGAGLNMVSEQSVPARVDADCTMPPE
jgi:hypothetical protein